MFQNPGRFIIDPNDQAQRLQSLPRNPTIIRLFRHAKLSENSGYGFDKMLVWKEKTGMDVVFNTDLLLSDITFYRKTKEGTTPVTTPVTTKESIEEKITKIVIPTPQITKSELANLCGMTVDGIRYHLSKMRKLV